MAFVLKTFGVLQLVDEAGHVAPFPENGLLLLGYLLAKEAGSDDRTTLAEFLWGEADVSGSLSRMRKTIASIEARQIQLGAALLTFAGGQVRVDRRFVSLDFPSEKLLQSVDSFYALKIIVELMRQTFMASVNCRSDIFESWQAARRFYHAALLKDALRIVANQRHSQDEAALLREAALILFRDEPSDDDTLQLLVKALNAEEDVNAFQAHFDQRRKAVLRGSTIVNGVPVERQINSLGRLPPSAKSELVAPLEKSLPRLVLLPPSNQAIAPAAGVLASSLIDDITIGFCAFNSLQVIAPYSAVQIGHQMEVQQAFFKQHSINYVLDTRISDSGDSLRLYSQLIFVDNNEIVWAERFSLNNLDLVRDRRLISRHVALCISTEIARHDIERADVALNPTAYHRYLVGKRYLSQLTLPNLQRARNQMRASLSASPDFAPALSTLARTYSEEWLLTARGDAGLLKQAEGFAAQAIAARGDSADGYREFGFAKLLQGAIDESAEAMEVAEILGPHYADVIADHADTLVHFSRPEPALRKIEHAIDLNPLSPDTYLWTAAGATYALRQFEQSLDYINQMTDPGLADRLAAANLAMLGQLDQASMIVQRARRANPEFDVEKWLSVIPIKQAWHRDLYREGLKKAGF
ncbi:hypothetical protein [Rhizobium sp. 18055]|uniref:hypothetical protein n=1 Tax=Rhizobium sp. 18055 TaxID=2681403 RepID=UPI00135AE32C|nr:hypothetical protein [Rhizobium sp. 18055]